MTQGFICTGAELVRLISRSRENSVPLQLQAAVTGTHYVLLCSKKSLHGVNIRYITAKLLPGIMSLKRYFKPLLNNTDTQRLCARVKRYLFWLSGRLISLSFTPSGPIPRKSRCKHRKVSSKLNTDTSQPGLNRRKWLNSPALDSWTEHRLDGHPKNNRDTTWSDGICVTQPWPVASGLWQR